MANRYIEGKADEYSSKLRLVFDRRTISRGLDKRGNPDTRQEIRNQTTRQHEKTRLNYNETRETRKGSVKQLTLGENNTGD